MPIKEDIYETIDNHLIPLWRGGKQVPEMLRSYENAPPSEKDGTNVNLHCNTAVVPDGGLVDGNLIENSIVDRNVETSGVTISGQSYEVPDNENNVDSHVGEFTYYTEDTIEDNFEI